MVEHTLVQLRLMAVRECSEILCIDILIVAERLMERVQ